MNFVKKLIYNALIALSMGALFACTKLDTVVYDTESDEYTKVVMTVSPSVYDDEPETKNVANIVNGSVQFVWSATDSIGIFPTLGSQIYFSMADGAGQKTASFDGGGWALKKGSEYYSYYPFIPSFYIDKTAVPLSFIGQSQKGNGDPSRVDLGKYCYMTAMGTTDDNTGALHFDYKRLGILFIVKIPVEAGVYKTLKMSVDDKILPLEGTFNAIAVDQVINDPVFYKDLSLSLEELTMTESGTLLAYMMLPAFSYLNRQVNFILEKEDGTQVISSCFGKDYQKNVTYSTAPKFSVSPSAVEIDCNGGSAAITILQRESVNAVYNVTTDANWLTVNAPSGGSGTITVTALSNSDRPRTATVVVSESKDGVSTTLRNVITVYQDKTGMSTDIKDWGNNGTDQGGTAY